MPPPVRALVAQATILPKAGKANLSSNRSSQRPDLRSFRVYRRFSRSLRSELVRIPHVRSKRLSTITVSVTNGNEVRREGSFGEAEI